MTVNLKFDTVGVFVDCVEEEGDVHFDLRSDNPTTQFPLNPRSFSKQSQKQNQKHNQNYIDAYNSGETSKEASENGGPGGARGGRGGGDEFDGAGPL